MLTTESKSITNVEPLLNKAISHISQFATLYEKGTTASKRKIIGSIFPEKLSFDGTQCRITRIKEEPRFILLFYNYLYKKNQKKSDLSQDVGDTELFTNHFMGI
jgi:site-specific DNA recombinase